MTPEPQAAPEPLTAEEERLLRFSRSIGGAPIDYGPTTAVDRLLATLDAARASQAAPVASGALDDEIRSFVANVEIAAEDNGTPAVLIADLWALARDRIRDRAASCLNCNGTGVTVIDGAHRPCTWEHPDTAGEPGEGT